MSEKPKKTGGKGAGAAATAAKAEAKPPVKETAPVSKSRTLYHEEAVPYLMKRFAFTSPMQVPQLKKIVVNMGVGDSLQNIKLLDAAVAELGAITGQKPAIRRARKSIANFKLRTGQPIGAMSIPTIRDFRGLSPKSFDGRGNYTFGIKEQVIFAEIKYDKVEKIRGMDITVVTNAKNDEEGYELLKAMKWPFRERLATS
jgi:large subunit ribosomal protein L5